MEWELEVTVGTMDGCGEKEADSQWRTSVTTRIKKIKRTGLDRAVLGVSEQATVSDSSSWEGWTPYWNIIL